MVTASFTIHCTTATAPGSPEPRSTPEKGQVNRAPALSTPVTSPQEPNQADGPRREAGACVTLLCLQRRLQRSLRGAPPSSPPHRGLPVPPGQQRTGLLWKLTATYNDSVTCFCASPPFCAVSAVTVPSTLTPEYMLVLGARPEYMLVLGAAGQSQKPPARGAGANHVISSANTSTQCGHRRRGSQSRLCPLPPG